MARVVTCAALLACLAWPIAVFAAEADQGGAPKPPTDEKKPAAEADQEGTAKPAAAEMKPAATAAAETVAARAVGGAPPNIASTSRAALEVATLVSECAEDMTCPFLSDFRTKQANAFAWLRAWCLAREGTQKRSPAELRVCHAATMKTEAEVQDETKSVPVFDLVEVSKAISPPTCSGFGLVVPLYSVRRVGSETVASGPVKAGLGGGYYWGLVCKPSFSFGPEAFGYSEGLDPSGLMHVAVAGGLQIIAYKYFQFGLALGWDIYRREAGSPANGLLAWRECGKTSFSWLITFSVVPQETKK